jgi:release factor glutamine methyltransferase
VSEGPETIAALRRAIARDLADATRTPALDARLLVALALGVAPNDVILRDEERAPAEVAARARALARRRADGEPVARIAGEKEFYGLTFRLGPATLVPRPDSETLVDAALAFVDGRDGAGGRDAALRLLDLGTGSGALLLALLHHLPRATGLGIDVAPDAVTVARDNATRLGLAGRAAIAVGDWLAGIAGPFDLVVSNPPYIESGAIAALAVDVKAHDPHVALDGGADGLAAIRPIIAGLDRVLAPDGAAFIEIGAGQAEAVAAIAGPKRFAARFHRDLAGIERVAEITRKP